MLQVIASFANDFISYKNQVLFWWPAYYIENILKRLESKYIIITWTSPCEVTINKDVDDQDIGQINTISPIELKPFWPDISCIVISTILDEVDIEQLHNINIPLFIDIQGFVRDRHWWWKKNQHSFVIGSNITVYKCTWEEFKYVNPELSSIARGNKNIYFIVTHWGNGIDLYNEWMIVKRISENKLSVSDTIWAGDTFLWACAYYFEQWNTLLESVILSSKQTQLFLQDKKNFKITF